MSKGRKLEDWIDAWVDYTDNTEPPRMFKLWAGLATIAACMKRKCVFFLGSERFFPNMYVVLVGPSGTRKNTAITPAEKFLELTGVDLAANSTTRQQLIRALRKSNETEVDPMTGAMDMHSSLNIFNSELTVFLGYKNLELITDLIDWFDCKDNWRYETKHDLGGGNVDHIRGVWVNILGGTTPDLIRSAMPSEAIGFGLTSRIVFIFEQKRGATIIVPTYKDEIKDDLLHDLYDIKTLRGDFKATPQFLDRWVEWRYECDNDPPFVDSNFLAYMERRPTHTVKLAMICSASRGNSRIIEVEDLERAIRILKATEIKMRYTFSGVGKSTTFSTLAQVEMHLGVHGEASYPELLERFQSDVDKRGMDQVVETLMAMNKIDQVMKDGERVFVYRGESLATKMGPSMEDKK